jgi:hypothetical protein
MKIGTCQLCLKQEELAFSHIYPEFFYKGTYDDSHRFISVTSHPRHHVKPFQKGFREHLLCKNCEGQFSRYESYAATLLRQISKLDTNGKRHLSIPQFDYVIFKLFALSVIWRCHITSLHTFQSVKLGSHAKRIRQMLLAEDSRKPNQYGIVLVKIAGVAMADRVLLPPGKTSFGGLPAYFATALGYKWIFIMSNPFQIKDEHYPVIGVQSDLVIPIWHQNEREFVEEMKSMIPKVAS